MSRAQKIEADLTWTGERFERGVVVSVGADGRIDGLERAGDRGDRSGDWAPRGGDRLVKRLKHRALLPGFVNSHSHAFQRALRGRGENFPVRSGSFWTWREAMYSLVSSLDPNSFLQITIQAFREMRSAGITTVGEFHYVHHSTDEGEDFLFDDLVLRAASNAGIRLVMLQTYYASGGIGKPLAGGQRRFKIDAVERYWREMDRLGPLLRMNGQTLGAVAHSVRAATPGEIAEISAEAKRRGLVFHLHLEEQRQEIEDCRAAYGATPMAVLLGSLDSLDHVTAVHCTHSEPRELEAYFERGGRACLCPTTEGNLGDGHPTLVGETARERLALGSDSNARISPLEEMRWLEYGQRLRTESRGVLRGADGEWTTVALRAATEGGAEALGIEAGRIAPGRWADFALVDLEAASVQGFDDETLLASLVCGADNEVIAATAVGGLWQDHRSGAKT
jgi:formimidoylglutamate deiminase